MSDVTRHRPCGDSVPTEFVLSSDYDQLKSENERLKLRLWDLEHSEVDHVLRERDQLKSENERLRIGEGISTMLASIKNDERDRLRAQLAEARKLLNGIERGCLLSDDDEKIDVWLQANK